MEINYKGFGSRICFSSKTDTFYGEVLNADDLIAFQADTLNEAVLAMQEAVERYLLFKRNRGLSPVEMG